jgi:hypothetical protein
MPLPLIPAIVAAATAVSAAYGVKKGVDATSDLKKAKDIMTNLESKYKKVFHNFEQQRNTTNNAFETLGRTKLSVLAGTMNDFVTSFEKLKNVDFTDQTSFHTIEDISDSRRLLQDIKKQALHAVEVLGTGVTSVAGGAAAAFGAVGAAVAFASASTGTAIASLSGVAATNATLAFFGGGSLAAGGLGMAGGTLVLGGIALAPALAIGGALFASTAKKKLEEAKAEKAKIEVEMKKLEATTETMHSIEQKTLVMNRLTQQLDKILREYVSAMQQVISTSGVDYKAYGATEKKVIFQSYQYAETLKKVLDQPIIDENGVLHKNINDTIKVAEKKLQ